MKDRLLLLGATGLVGSTCKLVLQSKFEVIAPSHREVDITKFRVVRETIRALRPAVILNCAGFTNVDAAEANPDIANALNTEAPKFMAWAARFHSGTPSGIPLLHLSTDYVFDGQKRESPYTEEDETGPLSTYSKTKRLGEEEVLAASKKHAILRIIMPYSATYKRRMDITRLTLDRLQKGKPIFAVTDQTINPIFVEDLANALNLMLKEQVSGIWHLGATSYTSPFEFMVNAAKKCDLDPEGIAPISFSLFYERFAKERPAPRPQHSWLDTKKFRNSFGEGILHTAEEGLEIFKRRLD